MQGPNPWDLWDISPHIPQRHKDHWQQLEEQPVITISAPQRNPAVLPALNLENTSTTLATKNCPNFSPGINRLKVKLESLSHVMQKMVIKTCFSNFWQQGKLKRVSSSDQWNLIQCISRQIRVRAISVLSLGMFVFRSK